MKTIKDIDVKNKYVLVRVDFNLPLDKKGNVTDNTRIKEALPTINYLLKNKAMIILMTHLGRPKGEIKEKLHLNNVAEELKKLLKKEKGIYKLDDCLGQDVEEFCDQMIPGEIVLLENLRFYKEEKEDDHDFAQGLASLADVYVNDAFATSHRKHASVHAITNYLPSVAGLLMEKEINNLTQEFKKPLVWIIGGIKEDKVKALQDIKKKADCVLIGSGLVDKVKKSDKVVLPVDFKEKDGKKLDIGPKTIDLFKDHLKKAKTIIWNGPLGKFEEEEFAKGTKEIAKAVADSKAFTIIGGGESAEAIKQFNLDKKMGFISTGGGASLALLIGKELPALKALEDNNKKDFKKI